MLDGFIPPAIIGATSIARLAWRLPRTVTIAWVVLVEVLLAFWIRDNLTLNILMLVYPIEAIKTWQAGL